jgi:hypothetical protein
VSQWLKESFSPETLFQKRLNRSVFLGRVAMKKQMISVLPLLFASSLACQFLMPSRTGTVISNCADLVSAVANLQTGEIPQHLFETGKKQGYDCGLMF